MISTAQNRRISVKARIVAVFAILASLFATSAVVGVATADSASAATTIVTVGYGPTNAAAVANAWGSCQARGGNPGTVLSVTRQTATLWRATARCHFGSTPV